MAARTPLSSRPLDLLYFTFFLIHLPASLLLDCQPLYPPSLVPHFISQLPKKYIQLSADPLVGGAMGYANESNDFLWFKTFLFVEAFFQVPVFILGLKGLWKGMNPQLSKLQSYSCSIYLLLLVYGASTATTTLPCLTVLLSTPITSVQSITVSQRYLLLSSYLPFFVLPMFMAVDMAMRIAKLLQAGVAVTAERKSQ
ncbi:hypothetical protein OG21DRAFT_1598514 [Imleria badia]|nr:hypothetical protein OG21DRAFT_1598514 [Imleria badia]